MTVRIISASRSPLNKQQWLVGYSCGHDGWLTAKRKPSGRRVCSQMHARGLGPNHLRLDLEAKQVPVLSIKCPTCGAVSDEECTEGGAGSMRQVKPHAARIKAAAGG